MRNKKPIEIALSKKGSNLYIFFGGIASGIAMPPFEFYNASKIIDESKIFVRDFSQCWYQDGLPGISKNIYSTADYIKKQIKELTPKKVFFVGNSMGGYSAILFALLIGSGEVVAFSPQTFIAPTLCLWHREFRWKRQLCTTYIKSFFKKKVWDLKPLLLKQGGALTISVFVSKEDRLDMVHASHIKNIPGVKIYEFEGGGHDIVKELRDEGKLTSIMSGTYAHRNRNELHTAPFRITK